MARSTISGNSAAKGGGIYSTGLVDIQYSTLSGNHAYYYGGALFAPSTSAHTIRNSTISGNHGDSGGGAIYSASMNIYNSTITGNTTKANYASGAGLFLGASILESSIVARNTSRDGLIEDDVVAYDVITGSDNLIMASTGPVPVSITIDPVVGPLQDNGAGRPGRMHCCLAVRRSAAATTCFR